VTPEAERYLAKARHTLEKAGKMLSAGLTEDAGRTAYLAGYHAAEAFIFEKSGKARKSHKGVHVEFARLSLNEPRIDLELRRFLPQAYDLKAICDYELGPDAVVPHEKSESAIKAAARLIECIAHLLGDESVISPD
jgi:uncharacterized protein (UPF0332 family)